MTEEFKKMIESGIPKQKRKTKIDHSEIRKWYWYFRTNNPDSSDRQIMDIIAEEYKISRSTVYIIVKKRKPKV